MMNINEIFYSLQGEGYYSGTPAAFVRMSGCNLDCPFCDTDHRASTPMSDVEIVDAVSRYAAQLVVITGGEPAMQLTAELVDLLHCAGKYVAVETNGTLPLPSNVDWITLSPKNLFLGHRAIPVLRAVNELKVIYDIDCPPYPYPEIAVSHGRYLQPCDVGDPKRNAIIRDLAAEYCLAHPEWRLSLQIHKILNLK